MVKQQNIASSSEAGSSRASRDYCTYVLCTVRKIRKMSQRETRAALKIPFCSLIAPDLTIITAWLDQTWPVRQARGKRTAHILLHRYAPAVSIVLFDLILSRYYLKEVFVESTSSPNTTLASLTQNPHSHFSSLFCVGCVS